jgi:hypothetical protein
MSKGPANISSHKKTCLPCFLMKENSPGRRLGFDVVVREFCAAIFVQN